MISGEAKVVPSQQLQTIQHFEGGIVKKIHVRSGMDVTLGRALISLDPLESGAEYQAKRSEFIQGWESSEAIIRRARGKLNRFLMMS